MIIKHQTSLYSIDWPSFQVFTITKNQLFICLVTLWISFIFSRFISSHPSLIPSACTCLPACQPIYVPLCVSACCARIVFITLPSTSFNRFIFYFFVQIIIGFLLVFNYILLLTCVRASMYKLYTYKVYILFCEGKIIFNVLYDRARAS